MRRKACSILALLALVLILGSGAAQALPVDRPAPAQNPGLLAAAWDWLTTAVPYLHAFEATDAAPTPPPPPPPTQFVDIGGFIDPNGGG